MSRSEYTNGALVVTLFLALAAPISAQPLAIDRAVARWVESDGFLSDATLATAIGLEVAEAWEADDRKDALVRAGLTHGVVEAATRGLKFARRRARPCAPSCGREDPDHSFPSGHTAHAFAAAASGRFVVSLPLAVVTGTERVRIRRHHFTDILAGAGLGWLAQWAIHRKDIP